MSNSKGTTGLQSSRAFSDDVIRRFLLGRLRHDERPAFEAQLFADEELEARVRLAELELSDDYAFARLKFEDEELFRRAFLVTADRRRQLNVSHALRAHYSSPFWTELQIARGVKSFFSIKQPVRPYAFAAVVIILLIATAWLVTREPQIVRDLFPKRAAPRPSATATPQSANHPPNTGSEPRHAEESPAMPAHELPAATVTLDSKDTLEIAPTVKLPQNPGDVVRLQLMMRQNPSRTYQAEIVSIKGETTYRVESLTPHDSRIDLDIPVRLLKSGAYQVELNGSESMQSVAIYYFRVQ